MNNEDNRVFMSRKKISLIVAPWKFDVIKTSGFALASRANICFKNIKFPRGNADINARHVLVTVVNKIGRPNTTRTVRGICRFAVYFLVSTFLSLHSSL